MCTAWSASRTCRAPRSQSEYTATVGIPSSRHARMTRTAISPRFAISTFIASIVIGSTAWDVCGRRASDPGPRTSDPGLQRNVAVLLRRVLVPFGLEPGEGRDQFRARLARADHFVDEAARGG